MMAVDTMPADLAWQDPAGRRVVVEATPGDVILIVGDCGAGKSVAAAALVGTVARRGQSVVIVDAYGTHGGSRDGRVTVVGAPAAARARVGLGTWLLLDPYEAWPEPDAASGVAAARAVGAVAVVLTTDARAAAMQALTRAPAAVLLLRLRRDAGAAALAALVGLSDVERDRLRTARVGEGLLIAGHARTWVRIAPAPHETRLLYGR